MKIVAKAVINTSHHSVAEWRNECIRSFLIKEIPYLQDWYLGTLNIEVVSPDSLKIREIVVSGTKEIYIPPMTKPSYNPKTKMFYQLPEEIMKFLPVKFDIEGKVKGIDRFLYIPSKSPHPEKGVLELIAKEKLCDKFNVQDGDIININL